MLARIPELLAPPVFEGDEDKTRTARVLNTLLMSVMLLELSASRRNHSRRQTL
jgi:hypothetical protein